MLFFFKQKTAYEMRISDWSSDVCSSDLLRLVAADLGGHRVDEERHVVVDDLDHAVLRFPAILGRIGIVGADACLAGGALLQPLPQGKGAAGQVVGGAAAQVAWRHVGEELPPDRLRALGPVRRPSLLGPLTTLAAESGPRTFVGPIGRAHV